MVFFRLCLACLGLLLAAVDCLASEKPGQLAAARRPQCRCDVWMAHAAMNSLAADAAQCPTVARRLGLFEMFIDAVNRYSDDDLRAIARFCEANHLPIGIECGGTVQFASLDENEGQTSAAIELRKLDRLLKAGAQPAIVILDDPVARTMLLDAKDQQSGRKGLSLEQATGALVDFLRAMRKALPQVQFVMGTNFLNWGWKGQTDFWAKPQRPLGRGDFHRVLRAVLQRTTEAGLPLRAVAVDAPYDYVTGRHPHSRLPDPTKIDWMGRVRGLEDFVHGRGLEFCLIVNSETPGVSGDDRRYAAETLEYMNAYRARGGRPDHWIVESWYPNPKRIAPESEAGTFGWLVKAAIESAGHDGPTPLAAPAAGGVGAVIDARAFGVKCDGSDDSAALLAAAAAARALAPAPAVTVPSWPASSAFPDRWDDTLSPPLLYSPNTFRSSR